MLDQLNSIRTLCESGRKLHFSAEVVYVWLTLSTDLADGTRHCVLHVVRLAIHLARMPFCTYQLSSQLLQGITSIAASFRAGYRDTAARHVVCRQRPCTERQQWRHTGWHR